MINPYKILSAHPTTIPEVKIELAILVHGQEQRPSFAANGAVLSIEQGKEHSGRLTQRIPLP